MKIKNVIMKDVFKKIVSILFVLTITFFIASEIKSNNVFAAIESVADTSFVDSPQRNGNIQGLRKPVISPETILEIADKTVEREKRKQESKILLVKQPFDFKKENGSDYCIVSHDKEIAVSNSGNICGLKAGKYRITVFYTDFGLVDYNLEIRDAETNNNIPMEVSIGEELNLEVKNADLATYSSSDEDIVSVSPDGTITCLNTGTATVTVTINDFQKIDYQIDSRAIFDYYDDEELRLIYAIVQQECAISYEGALAVISCAYNRSMTPAWAHHGRDPLSQLTAKNQFCYSLDNYWERYLEEGTIHDYVKQAVYDCLYLGITNHDYLSFRSYETEGSVLIGDNYFFNSMYD